MAMWRYDVERLEIYHRHDPRLPIEVRRIGPSLALKFEGVGYFNRAIGPAAALDRYAEELVEFYAGGGLPFRLSLTGPASQDREVPASAFTVSGAEEYFVREVTSDDRVREDGWSMEKLSPQDAHPFFSMYLKNFAGPDCRVREAMANMIHLPEMAGLHCFWALMDGQRVGLGMMHVQGTTALFCAAAIAEGYRGRGGHLALLRHRLHLAGLCGCRRVVAVAKPGSDSARNLLKTGFRVMWKDEALLWRGADRGESPAMR
jgi:hypothetical protein